MEITRGMPYRRGTQAYTWWEELSAAYAESIPKGNTVNVFLNNPSEEGIWNLTEKPILIKREVTIIEHIVSNE